jgi:hypothetical protein
MSQNHYLLSDKDVELLRDFFESFHWMVFEFIESRKCRDPDAQSDWPERQNYSSLYEELDALAQQKFDF